MDGYHAFISYSHSADGRFAPGLKAGLQRFAKPWFRLRALKVFLDGANLNLSPHLWSSIEKALGASEHFVYLASPEAAASKWVQKELSWWCAHRPKDRLLIIVTAGEVAWDDAANDFDWTRTSCIPRLLSGQFAGEPFFLDLRWARTAQDLSVQNPRFQQAVALLSATLQGKAVEDLVGEELEQHRRTTRLRNGVIATLAVLLVATAAAAFQAVRESAEARRQQQEALRQRDHALAAALHNRVQLALGNGALAQATRWVLAGMQHLGSDAVVQQAAMDVATHGQAVLSTVREPQGSAPQVEFSPDGQQFLVVARSPLLYYRARLFDLNGSELRSFDRVQTAAILPDGRRLQLTEPGAPFAEEEADGSICDGNEHVRLEPITPSPLGVAGATEPQEVAAGLQRHSADGLRQLSVCGNFIRWGAVPESAQRWRLPGVVAAVLSADERWIAAVFAAHTLLLPADAAGADPGTGIRLQGVGPVFAPDAALVATVQAGHTLLWNLLGQPQARLRGVRPVLGPGGIVVTQDGAASWLWRPGAAPLRLEGTEAQLSPDGEWIMTTLSSGRTRVTAADGSELTLLDGVSGRFAPAPVGGRLALTATPAGLVRLWDLSRLPASTPEPAERLWRLAPGELAALAPTAPGEDGCNRDMSLVCSTHGPTRLATRISLTANRAEAEWRFVLPGQTSNVDEPLALWEGPVLPERRCAGPIAKPAFAAAGEQDVAIGCADGLIRVFTREGRLRWERRQTGPVSYAAFAPDATRLLTASSTGMSRVWDATTGEPLAEISGQESDIAAAGLSAGAAWAFTLSSQGSLQLWRLQQRTGTLAASLRLEDDVIEAVSFSRDGHGLLGRTRSGRWHRWLAQPGELAHQYAWLSPLSGSERQALGLER